MRAFHLMEGPCDSSAGVRALRSPPRADLVGGPTSGDLTGGRQESSLTRSRASLADTASRPEHDDADRLPPAYANRGFLLVPTRNVVPDWSVDPRFGRDDRDEVERGRTLRSRRPPPDLVEVVGDRAAVQQQCASGPAHAGPSPRMPSVLTITGQTASSMSGPAAIDTTGRARRGGDRGHVLDAQLVDGVDSESGPQLLAEPERVVGVPRRDPTRERENG